MILGKETIGIICWIARIKRLKKKEDGSYEKPNQ